MQKQYTRQQLLKMSLKELRVLAGQDASTRYYPDGSVINSKLPVAYGLPPREKKYQRCHNCKFYKNDYCSLWKAPVRDEYWCKSWQK